MTELENFEFILFFKKQTLLSQSTMFKVANIPDLLKVSKFWRWFPLKNIESDKPQTLSWFLHLNI